MASDKKKCMHCCTFIASNSKFCSKCGSRNPFLIRCPECLREVNREDVVCSCCGRNLIIKCQVCGKDTFVLDKCEKCGTSFLIECPNRRCGELVFFQNDSCTMCGRRLK